ncbi:MAG: winged helix-turn-helix domain-containing protein [Anaerolineales bacterium]|nr:winged helix-turn-helix domain-containing protein [Anaerolineales bacterium]
MVPRSGYWTRFPLRYRAAEMGLMAGWLAAGESGSVVSLPGAGRATLLNFLCQRPDALALYLPAHARPVVLVPVDLNTLPDNTLATLYRVILRAFSETRDRFPAELQEAIVTQYRKHEATRDPFLSQSGLRELLLLCQAAGLRVALVLNRFDQFCRAATPEMTTTLRGLRDAFKDTLLYLAGMRQEAIYLTDVPGIEPVAHLLISRVCWVGPLSEADGLFMIHRQTRHLDTAVSPDVSGRLRALTGGLPSLLRIACHWWLAAGGQPDGTWTAQLLARADMQRQLADLWASLSQEEQAVLAALQEPTPEPLKPALQAVLPALVTKGVCRIDAGQGRIASELLAAFVAETPARSRGKVWQHEQTREIYLGAAPVADLKPMERAVLEFLLEYPRIRHTHTQLIEGAWPEDASRDGVSNDALYQAIRGIRKRIEPNPGRPVYVINWRGQPEGGYQFFPEGRPAV